MNRRQFLLSTIAASTVASLPFPALSAQTLSALSYADLVGKAKRLAETGYEKPKSDLSDFWKELSLQEYSKIYYNPHAPLWKDSGKFQLQFFHPGGPYFHDTVPIHIQEGKERVELKPTRDMFWYEGPQPSKADLESLGFAGFRVHHPLNSEYYDELISFLGASYFRFLGAGQHYGLSQRGLAIDTVEDSGEEFPVFREFWIEKPSKHADELSIMALLDSPSVSGAYHFLVKPGENTVLEVEAELFARKDIKKLGIAPMTSMFLFGENTKRLDDYRPEVHDSDGLLIHNGQGEWLWRPLTRRKRVTVNAFLDENPKGFGLLQRDQRYENYNDLESRYQIRPSVWVEPQSDWGRGHVELAEINSDLETTDNIVAYWVPEKPVRAGDHLKLRYNLTSFLQNDAWPPAGYTTSTRIGPANRPGFSYDNPEHARYFVVEFYGKDLSALAEDTPLEAEIDCANGEIRDLKVSKNPRNNHWRMAFNLVPEGEEHCDLRAYLKHGDSALTETWTYLWTGPSA